MTQFTNAALRLGSVVAVATVLVLLSMGDTGAQSSGAQSSGAQPSGAKPAATPASYKVPRTAWGHPDLQGVWTSNDIEATKVIAAGGQAAPGGGRAGAGAPGGGRAGAPAPEGGRAGAGAPGGGRAGGGGRGGGGAPAGAVNLNEVNPPGHWLETGTRVTMGAPTMTPLGKERASIPRLGFGSFMSGSYAGPEELGTWVRCITRGVPGVMLPQVYNNNYQIMQSPDSVVVMSEMIHEARVLPLTPKPRAPDSIRQWTGDSRARWEGDTLVVEVTNFNDQVAFRGSTDRLRVEERYTRTSPTTLLYQATLEDPGAWAAPWTFSLTFTRDPGQDYVFEYACHEGNYGMFNLLSASRKMDAEAAR